MINTQYINNIFSSSINQINKGTNSSLTDQNVLLNSFDNEFIDPSSPRNDDCSFSPELERVCNNDTFESKWITFSTLSPTMIVNEKQLEFDMPNNPKALICEDVDEVVYQTVYDDDGKQDSSSKLHISMKITNASLLELFQSTSTPGDYVRGFLRLFDGSEVQVSNSYSIFMERNEDRKLRK